MKLGRFALRLELLMERAITVQVYSLEEIKCSAHRITLEYSTSAIIPNRSEVLLQALPKARSPRLPHRLLGLLLLLCLFDRGSVQNERVFQTL